MNASKNTADNKLVERMVRNDSIFCSLLFDPNNGTLRVVDFRGGNFQTKHNYLELIVQNEGVRKVFTLIERDDMNGWQRVGYHREGTIPGYYKRSDAYIMSRIYDADWKPSAASDDTPERRALMQDIKNASKDAGTGQVAGLKVELLAPEDVVKVIKAERTRANAKARKAKTKAPRIALPNLPEEPPLFPQFSREVEYFYYAAINRRTKQSNVYGVEFQDCFSNAKIDICFSPSNVTDHNITRHGLEEVITQLMGVGVVSVFSLVRADDLGLNASLAASGFRNTGWLNRQVVEDEGSVDLILWSRKLV